VSAVLSPAERLADLEALNREMEGAPPEEILRLAAAAVPQGRLALVSAFGPASLVTIHLMAELELRLPVIFIDTLHHFPETLELAERVRARYDLDLRVYRPAENRSQFDGRYGPRLWERDLDRYQRVSKVEPFRRATRDFDAWLTGRRRDQARTRHHLPVFEGGEKLRVNPLAGWSRAQVWRFLLEHGVPYNPLHDRGYSSIGDEPLTTPVLPGEPERAGRWRGLGRLECGIHQS
jgi:phosphoadenosine phosphosulfate reductase